MRETWDQLAEAAAKAAATPLWPLVDGDVIDSLRTVHRWETYVAALKARLAQEAEVRGIPADQGHRNLARWLRALLLLDPQPARELAEQAAALQAHPQVERALLDGQIDARQAVVIAAAIDAIPATLRDAESDALDPDLASLDPDLAGLEPDQVGLDPDLAGRDPDLAGRDPDLAGLDPDLAGLDPDLAGPDPDLAGLDPDPAGLDPDPQNQAGPPIQLPGPAATAAAAETALIEMANQFPAYQLRRLGERILFHVAPEIAERAEEAALRRQEERAHRTRSFTLSRPAGGMVHISGTLDLEAAAIVEAALQPLCHPNPADDRTPRQQRADALIDICRLALRTGDLPAHSGEPPQLAITIKYDPLAHAIRASSVDNGERLSATTARRLACDARIMPILLGGDGQILDAGRTRRTADGPLRRALVARDAGCTFPGCDRPPRWCDAHHLTPWTHGGPTSLDNLVLLCRHHHRVLHDPRHGWQARLATDHRPEFLPPPWLDRARHPRRNLFHLRL